MSKMGRPTEAKKDLCIKIRMDDETNRMLEVLVEAECKSKSEIIRQAIFDKYEKIKGGEQVWGLLVVRRYY